MGSIRTYRNSYDRFIDYKLEDIIGRKIRKIIPNNKRERSYLGNKPYRSPEYSPEFFKLDGVIVRGRYDPPIIRRRQSIKEQLGPVEGIYTSFMKLPPIKLKLD